jgi:hypothetical protein
MQELSNGIKNCIRWTDGIAEGKKGNEFSVPYVLTSTTLSTTNADHLDECFKIEKDQR